MFTLLRPITKSMPILWKEKMLNALLLGFSIYSYRISHLYNAVAQILRLSTSMTDVWYS